MVFFDDEKTSGTYAEQLTHRAGTQGGEAHAASLSPQGDALPAGLADLPAREVGGDFYDFHPLSEDRLGLVVGDTTGKGVPAALVMSTTCGMLRAVTQALDSSSPGEVLKRVNEALTVRIPANMFVTCFYAILDPKNGRLVYANAGHELPYWRRHVGGAEKLRARGMPLDLMPEMGCAY